MMLVRSPRQALSTCVILLAAFLGGAGSTLLGLCGPFTDVSDASFCPFVLEIFSLGITTGTTPTTYDPAGTVNRLQMAAFLSRTVDGVLKRGGRRAALNRYWTPQAPANLGLTTVGLAPRFPVSDGEDIWVPGTDSDTVARVHASDGKLLQTWTGATTAWATLSAMGRVFVSGLDTPGGTLYRIDPSQTAGAVTTVATNLGVYPYQIAFDGSRIWSGNSDGSVSIVTPTASLPWTVTTVTTGFSGSGIFGALYDGSNIWVSDSGAGLRKLDSAGAILQTVTVGATPAAAVFDGTSIWVPNFDSASVSVVRVSNGAVLTTLTGNGLNQPIAAAFDGQRILVTNGALGADSVSLWKAADLTALGSFGTGPGTGPFGACSDGISFWITLSASNQLARF